NRLASEALGTLRAIDPAIAGGLSPQEVGEETFDSASELVCLLRSSLVLSLTELALCRGDLIAQGGRKLTRLRRYRFAVQRRIGGILKLARRDGLVSSHGLSTHCFCQ